MPKQRSAQRRRHRTLALGLVCHNSDKSRLRQAMTQTGLKEMRFAIDFEGSKVLVNF